MLNVTSIKKARARATKKMLAAHVEADICSEFKQIGKELGVSNEVLMQKAMALLFKKYHKPIPAHVTRTLKSNGLD